MTVQGTCEGGEEEEDEGKKLPRGLGTPQRFSFPAAPHHHTAATAATTQVRAVPCVRVQKKSIMSSNLDIGGTFNIHHKLRSRECVASKPGAHVHRIRNFYESVLPNHTVRSLHAL